ncbi:MAG: N-acetyltransferase [Arcobacteraceae bacterium]
MIRAAILKDSKELFTLESSVFLKDDFGLSLSSFYYHIKNNNLFLYEKDKKIIAYILWLKRKNYYRLYSLCVDKNNQGQGIAQKLLNHSLDILPFSKYTLEVKTTNEQAIKLYEKNGFKISKTLQNYYPNNIDGYLMIKG